MYTPRWVSAERSTVVLPSRTPRRGSRQRKPLQGVLFQARRRLVEHSPSSARKSTQLTGFLTCKHFLSSPVSMSQKRMVSSYEPLISRFPTKRICQNWTSEHRMASFSYHVGAMLYSSLCGH